MVALLTGGYRISKRNVVQLLDDCFGVSISVGSIKRLEADLCAALAAPVAEAQAYVQALRAGPPSRTHGRDRLAPSGA